MLKTSTRYRLGRVWLSLVAILLGILAGFFVGRVSILRSVKSRLAETAGRILQQDEELAAEVTNILAKANASPAPPCSQQDIILLRRLTFGARFLKDVGRLQDGNFVCSATTGLLPEPRHLSKPDIVLDSGLELFQSYPLTVPVGVRAEIVALQNADVVLSPDVFAAFPQYPWHYAAGVPDWSDVNRIKPHSAPQTVLRGINGTIVLPLDVRDSPQAVWVGDTLYRARCSSRFSVCAVSSVEASVLWRINRNLLLAYTATGALAGLVCASSLLTMGRKRRSQTNQLKRAILAGKLSVVYQPIVDLTTHRIVGAEALARWTDEDGESIRPETIIALAEAKGFVSDITRFVITRTLEEIRPILDSDPYFRVSINLAPSDLADPRLLLLLDERLNSSRLTPANIAFELPERATSDREVAVASIRRLRERGHAIFIDDFGTGYSNLAYLTELNVDGIKINRSFIATIGTESVTASIVPQILAVAKALSLNVVVQGIEREDQATYFAADPEKILGQGWFFGLPVPAKGLTYLCAERSE